MRGYGEEGNADPAPRREGFPRGGELCGGDFRWGGYAHPGNSLERERIKCHGERQIASDTAHSLVEERFMKKVPPPSACGASARSSPT